VCPTSPADVKGLLKSSVRDDDPIVFFEDMKLWTSKGDVPTDPDYLVPLGKAEIRHSGRDVTIVAIGGAMRATLKAAEALAADGIGAEVIDPRTLKPLDTDTILASVARTGRLVIVENAHRCVSASSEIAAIVAEEAFDSLKKPIIRLTAPDSHVPFSPALEVLMYPQTDQIVSAVRRLL